MANITRDSHDDTKNRKEVVTELGTPVVDADLNEAQKILMTEAVEGVRASTTSQRSTAGKGGVGFAVGDDFKPYGLNTSTIVITKGVLFADGYRLVLGSDLDLTSAGVGLAFPTVGSNDIYGYIYVDLVLAEVNSTQDATMANPLIGETSVRMVLRATWNKTESTTSFAAAYNAVADLPAVSDPRLWKGNSARIFLCRYKRPATTSGITSAMLVDMRESTTGEMFGKQKFIKTLRQLDSGSPDGQVIWNADQGRLQIGSRSRYGVGTNLYLQGIQLRQPNAPDAYAANNSGTYAAAQYASAPSDDATFTVDWTKGWAIGANQSLGWLPLTVDATSGPLGLMTKGKSSQSALVDVSPNPSTAPDALIVQRLVVANTDAFYGDPSAWVLCTRLGTDLVWYNGQVTRGGSGTNNCAIEELGASPSKYRAIISATGADPGGNHLTGVDALERAMNLSTQSNTTLGGRVFRFFLRGGTLGGTYLFGRGIKRWGSTADVANKNTISLEGDEDSPPLLSFVNPQSSTRSSSDLGVFELFASTVKLKNLKLAQDNISSTFVAGYLLYIEADTVVLDNVTLDSAVYIKADNIIVRNCTFDPGVAHLNNANFAATQSGNPLVAAAMYLTPRTSGPTRWSVYNNNFKINTIGVNDTIPGSHAAVVLNDTSSGIVTVRANIFDGTTYNQGIPSIHIAGKMANVAIRHNRFFGAIGVAKTGYSTATHGSFPWNGYYAGAPLIVPNNTGGSTANITQAVATGYISLTAGRDRTSALLVSDNYFDMSRVGGTLTSSRFVFWGAMVCAFNYLTNGSNTSLNIHNIRFLKNNLIMTSDSGQGGSGWDSTGTLANPVIYGFCMMPLYQDCSSLTDVQLTNIRVSKNNFDLGGEGATAGIIARTWRSIGAPSVQSWPGSGNFIPDVSALVYIDLKDINYGGPTYTGRSGKGIVIDGNSILQRSPTGGTNPPGSILFCSQASHPYYSFYAILVSSGNWSAGSNETFATGEVLTSGNVLYQTRISKNNIVAPYYIVTGAYPAETCGIKLLGSHHGKVIGNQIWLSGSGAANSGDGINCTSGSISDHITGNTVFALVGARADNGYISNNMFKGCGTPYVNSSGGLGTFNSGSNFA